MIDLLGSSGAFSIGRLVGYLYIITIVFAGYKLVIIKERAPYYLLVVYILIFIVAGALHVNIVSSQVLDYTLLQNIVLYFILLIHERNDPGILNKGLSALIYGTVLLSIFFAFGIGIERSGDLDGRLSIFGDNENMVGIRMAFGSLTLLYYINESKNKISYRNGILLIGVILMVLMMRETSSRTAIISFTIALLFMMYLHVSINKSIKRYLYVFVFGLFISLYLLPMMLSNELLLERLTLAKEGDLASRDIIWQALIPSIMESPYIGYGYAGYQFVSWQVLGRPGGSPHNVILEVMLFTGIFGFIIFIIFNLYVLRGGVKMYIKEKKYLGLLLLIPYAGMLVVGHTLGKKIMWYILAYNSISLFRDYNKK